MVRLKVQAISHCEKLSQFQFHYGSIKGDKDGLEKRIAYRFNSTMVRLKVVS